MVILATAAAAEFLGGYSEPEAPLHVLGRVGFFIALVAVGVLERIQFRLRFLETRTWWASNGRDVLNLAAFFLLAAALRLIGFGGPLAFVIASTVLVLMIALQGWLSLRRHGAALSVLAAIALGAPVLVSPPAVDAAMKGALHFLFR